MKDLQVTTLEQLKEYANGQIVELPPFAERQPFVARMKRPSILGLVEQGKIPNILLSTAQSLFMGTKVKGEDEDAMLQNTLNVINILAKESFISPTFEELKEAGIQLTDDQLMFVFNYAQNGPKALKNFRSE